MGNSISFYFYKLKPFKTKNDKDEPVDLFEKLNGIKFSKGKVVSKFKTDINNYDLYLLKKGEFYQGIVISPKSKDRFYKTQNDIIKPIKTKSINNIGQLDNDYTSFILGKNKANEPVLMLEVGFHTAGIRILSELFSNADKNNFSYVNSETIGVENFVEQFEKFKSSEISSFIFTLKDTAKDKSKKIIENVLADELLKSYNHLGVRIQVKVNIQYVDKDSKMPTLSDIKKRIFTNKNARQQLIKNMDIPEFLSQFQVKRRKSKKLDDLLACFVRASLIFDKSNILKNSKALYKEMQNKFESSKEKGDLDV